MERVRPTGEGGRTREASGVVPVLTGVDGLVRAGTKAVSFSEGNRDRTNTNEAVGGVGIREIDEFHVVLILIVVERLRICNDVGKAGHE